jgi:hypothetical protein
VITFTINRGAATSAALTLTLTIGGLATYGTDYLFQGPIVVSSPTQATVTIPANAISVGLFVLPLGDVTVESAESVTLAISSSGGQSVLAPVVLSASIVDEDVARNLIVANTTNLTEVAQPPIVGTSGADQISVIGDGSRLLFGGAGDDLIVVADNAAVDNTQAVYQLTGDEGDDTIIGGGVGFNLLTGSNEFAQGLGEHDNLVGKVGATNYFLLGDQGGCWYSGSGYTDYVSISNFDPLVDVISLAKTASSYFTQYNAHLTYLFYNKPNRRSDLIAKINSDARLLPTADCFTYAIGNS